MKPWALKFFKLPSDSMGTEGWGPWSLIFFIDVRNLRLALILWSKSYYEKVYLSVII